jgi:hypothetical protein
MGTDPRRTPESQSERGRFPPAGSRTPGRLCSCLLPAEPDHRGTRQGVHDPSCSLLRRAGVVGGVTLTIVPVTFRQACAFIATHHRHHQPPRGLKFAIGIADSDGDLAGVATVGRPVARHMDDGRTVEVTRTCTRDVRNANSMLYAASWRAARALGYHRMITYTQHGETGASLRAAGLQPVAHLRARPGWNTPSRPRSRSGSDDTPRTRWEIRRKLAGSARPSSESGTGIPCAPADFNGTAGPLSNVSRRAATSAYGRQARTHPGSRHIDAAAGR